MIELDETSSTNSYLRDYHPLTAVDITLVTAEHQTAGRGQQGNSWESERSQNLLFSLQVQPSALPSTDVFVLSEAIALSIREAIAAQLGSVTPAASSAQDKYTVSVKWPNDIYVGDRKIAGILIENEFRGTHLGRCIIGCGVNINQERFAFASDGRPRDAEAITGQAPIDALGRDVSRLVAHPTPVPVSLYQLKGATTERRFVLEAIVDAFVRRYEAIQSGTPAAIAAIHADYLAALYRREGFHPFVDAQGLYQAEIADVEPTGHLILRDADGCLRRYAFKEVAYVKAN